MSAPVGAIVRGPSFPIAASFAVLVPLLGCGRGPFFTPDPCVVDPDACSSSVTLQRSLDILFVIDNSGSMGDEQGTLAANFPAFIRVIEQAQIGADYRIGLTTTDGFGLRATSCRSRLDEFVFNGLDGIVIDERQDGCLGACALQEVQLVPTTTDDDPNPAVRPWLEKLGGRTNLPASVSIADALQCIGPQGINGSGFEAPLESMRRVLLNDGGFLRDQAMLAVIFVTDEADCSMPAEHLDAVISDEGRALWSDPTGERPTSAVCWNAGVVCEGGPGTYDSCRSENIGLDREPTVPEDAVLFPVDRYVDTLRVLAQQKVRDGGNGQVAVAVLAGVPLDYPEGGELVYRDSLDPEFNAEYGIGPGCGWGTETVDSPPGIPPVRLREFAEAFATEGRNIFPICSADYTAALQQIADTLGRLAARSCIPGCVSDLSDEPGVQPRCEVVERSSGGSVPIAPCEVDGNAWTFPLGVQTCYRRLDDGEGRTGVTVDDMSDQCVTRGANLEFIVERIDESAVAPGVFVEVDCQLDGPADETCDDL